MAQGKIYFSYYSLFLKKHLQDIGDSRADDVEFISEYAERAEIEFEEFRRDCLTVFATQEKVMSVLVSGV